MGKHAAQVQHLCTWKRYIAILVASVTAGAWIPFVTGTGGVVETREEQDDEAVFVVPPLLHETHVAPTWPSQSSGKVDLTKPPTKTVAKPTPKPKPSPSSSPTHAQPTPKQTVHPAPVPTKPTSALVAFLRAQLGDRYVYGGNGPDAWDCSGLTRAAYLRAYGMILPRTSEAQSLKGHQVSLSELRVGDLVFWGVGPGLAYHVGVYIGNGKYIAAQNPSVGVVERTLSYSPPDFARRIL
jgi:cell wall-associated NlpC family hydrolase